MRRRIAEKIAAARAKPKTEWRGGAGRGYSRDENLKCICGHCNVCKSRERGRAKREGRTPPDFPKRWRRKEDT